MQQRKCENLVVKDTEVTIVTVSYVSNYALKSVHNSILPKFFPSATELFFFSLKFQKYRYFWCTHLEQNLILSWSGRMVKK